MIKDNSMHANTISSCLVLFCFVTLTQNPYSLCLMSRLSAILSSGVNVSRRLFFFCYHFMKLFGSCKTESSCWIRNNI